MKIPNRTRLLRPIVVAALAMGVAAAAVTAARIDDSSATSSRDGVRHVETLAVTDLADDNKLVGIAHDVFVGRVVRQRGSTSEPLVETQFDVEVLRTVKGSLSGVVVVNQQGGIDERGDTVVVDGDPLLESGRTYLFASRTNETTGWHTLIPRYGILRADAAPAQANLVERFEAAQAAEVSYAPTG